MGGIDIDVEAIIKAITTKENLKEITEKIVKTTEKDKPKEENQEKQNQENQGNQGNQQEGSNGEGRAAGGDSGSRGGSGSGGGAYDSSDSGPEWTLGWSYDGKGWRYRTAKGFLYKTWSLLPWNGEDYWYFFGEEGYLQTGWQLINEKWYYLEQGVGQNQGHLLVNTTTADGYKVDAEGAWIE